MRIPIVFIVLSLTTLYAYSSTGILPIGNSAEDVAMAGVSAGFSQSPLGIDKNPAGYARTSGPQVELSLDYNLVNVNHKDGSGNDVDSEIKDALLFALAYTDDFQNYKGLHYGISVSAAGGSGFQYSNFSTNYGNKDQLMAQAGTLRISPSISYQVASNLFLGASATVNYSEALLSLFPETSHLDITNPQRSFFGLKVTGLNGISYGYRLGAQYQPLANVTIGFMYASKDKLLLESGEAFVNYDALIGRKVKYKKASIRGANLPRQVGIGVAYVLNQHWTIGADYKHINWSDALSGVSFNLYNADTQNIFVQDQIRKDQSIDQHDQKIFSLSAKYKYNAKLTFLSGINLSENPINRNSMLPLLYMLTDDHLGIGLSYIIQKDWTIDLAIGHALKNSQKGRQQALPISTNIKGKMESSNLIFTIQHKI